MLLHVGLVFEGELTTGSVAMEVGSLLASERAMGTGTILAASKPEKSLTLNGVIFSMVVEVHLDI